MYPPQDNIQQLADYIKKNLNKGYTIESLKVSLLNQGYSKISIEKAIERFNNNLAEKIPPIKEIPQITYRAITSDDKKSDIITIQIKKKNWWKRLFN